MLVLCLLGSLRAAADETSIHVGPEAHYERIVNRFVRIVPKEHLTRHPLDDDISRRAWTNYLSSLDYERIYFLESDIDAFRNYETTLDDQVKAGDLSFAYQVFAVFQDRVRNRTAHVDTLLETPFDTTIKETYNWKRKNAAWSRGQLDWDRLWHKRIKNEYIRRIVARSLEAESAVSNAVPKDAGADATNSVPDAAGPHVNGLPESPEDAIREEYEQFRIIMEDCDGEWVLQKYLTAFAQAYDPHSDYLSPSTEEDFNIEMKLSLVGIGALLRAEDGAAKIVRLIPGGPADSVKGKDRLEPGDKIIAVAQGDKDPVSILHWPLSKVVKLIRGEKGTRVVLTVLPASDITGTVRRRVSLIRDEVKLEEQAAKGDLKTIEDGDGVSRKLAVITVPAFYADLKAQAGGDEEYRSSSRDVANLLTNLAAQGAEGVLLDLRGNGGGSLPEAVDMTGLFIKSGPTVQVKERFGITSLPDLDPTVVYGGPLVVMVSRLSASASEILAGALQDYGRAIIVGDAKTHGKGTVQSVERLGSDEQLGSVKLTKWIFYRVSGSSTQLKGVVPDIILPSVFGVMEFGEEFLDHAIAWSRVPPADYFPVGNLTPLVPVLCEESLARRQNSPRFAAYNRFVERIREMNESTELPLDLDSRRTLAQTEKEMADLRKELADEQLGQEDDSNDEEPMWSDIVLQEGVRILADLVALQAAAQSSAPDGTVPVGVTPPAAPETSPVTVQELHSPQRRKEIFIIRMLLAAAVVVFSLRWMQRRAQR